MKRYYVYFMTNSSNKVLYTGMTNNLSRRVLEHKNKRNPRSFTARYNCNKLVYYEVFSTPMEAIRREKQLKGGNRKRKNALVDGMNPAWKDLSV